jgi:predicted ABC-type ATPase
MVASHDTVRDNESAIYLEYLKKRIEYGGRKIPEDEV